MKPRLAAALALVSWYLMLPPALPHDPEKVDASAPLSQWERMATFDSESECATEATRLAGTPLARVAKCIAGDDPRLKEKTPAN